MHDVPLIENGFCPPNLPDYYLNTWIPLVTLDQMQNKEYDALVVGSGAGGGAVLYRLCQQWRNKGMKIGMIEAGGLLSPTHVNNIPTLVGRVENYSRNPLITNPIGWPDLPGGKQVISLGGQTLLWAGHSIRFQPFEYAEWPVSQKEMEYYYNIAEQEMNVTVPPRTLETAQFLDRLWSAGFTEATEIPNAITLQLQNGSLHEGTRFSSLIMVGKAFNLSPVDIAVNAPAVRIMIQQGKVLSVIAATPDQRRFEIRARTIILSANVYQTPRLLLMSGIQGKNIGHFLVHHPFLNTNLIMKPSNPIPAFQPVYIPQQPGKPFHMNMYPTPEGAHLSVFTKVESRYPNRVGLDYSRRDAFGLPVIFTEFQQSSKDRMVVAQAAEEMRHVAKVLELDVESLCTRTPGSDYHEAGTCRMGDDPDTSATNRYGQVHGIQGLYVADNSVFPSVGATNPTLTTVALAIRTADYIAHRHS
ncbi:GMC family oxidoreductase [Paenibacillus sp. LHD-38]|uniref:GMC family oxidoreductase n=1 Tax=Paenibacillus sp. LHD-38 TaxID=3072143 RepID=UPI00280E5171|nr:GMC family oxidoreductase [Paenibacillus sp. LHD-38]MDQ8739463.1 GMC family oxidoreductase [Paenibacillus sp. LHD-38]